MKLRDPLTTVKALVGDNVKKSDRCCGESGTFGVTRPDIATQVRFRKQEESAQATTQRCTAPRAIRRSGRGKGQPVKILTSCPSCLQGLSALQG